MSKTELKPITLAFLEKMGFEYFTSTFYMYSIGEFDSVIYDTSDHFAHFKCMTGSRTAYRCDFEDQMIAMFRENNLPIPDDLQINN